MNEVMKAMIERRSCKKYIPDKMVPQEMVEQIVEAGLYAASAMNRQSPIILAVTEKETRDKLSQLNSKYDPQNRPDPFYGAPVVLVVLARKDAVTGVYDGSLVMGNMMLAAHTLGIGNCWIHRAKETFEDEEGIALLRSLGLEGEYEGIANCVLGYPEVLRTDIPPRREGRVYRIYEKE